MYNLLFQGSYSDAIGAVLCNGAVDGERLIAQAEDEIELLPAHIFIFFQHGDAVKQVSRIHQKGGEPNGEQGSSAAQQPHGYILHGSGVHGDAHHRRQPHWKAARLQHYPEAEAQRQIPCQYGYGVDEGLSDGAAHGAPSVRISAKYASLKYQIRNEAH